MPKVVVDKQSLQFVIVNFRGSQKDLRRAGQQAVGAAGREFRKAVRANISARPIGGSAQSHYAALAALGHPYARRFNPPNITPTTGGYPGIAKRSLLVHSVSGQLKSAVRGRFNVGASRYTLSVDTGKAPHARYVFLGTRVMTPRNILLETARDPAVLTALRRIVANTFGRSGVLRGGSGIRFGSI